MLALMSRPSSLAHKLLMLMLILKLASLVRTGIIRAREKVSRVITDPDEIENCSSVVSAWIKSDDFEQVVKDRGHFLFNLLDCTKETHKLILKTEDCKTFDEMIPSVLANVMNKNISEAINTTSFATKEARRILLAVYLVNISHKLRYFSCLANFWTKDIILTPQHKKLLGRFPLELRKYILGFLDSTLMVRWKNDNITILEENTNTLITMSIKFSITLINLLEEIIRDIDKTHPEDSSWSSSLSSSRVRNGRQIIAKLDELKTETVTLRNKLVMLKTPVIDPGLLEGFFNAMWQSIPTMLKQLLLLFAFLLGLKFIMNRHW